MRLYSLCIQLGVLIIFAISVFLGGCASTEIPLAETPPLYSQQKIQAADHWDNVANTVAMRIQKSMEDRPDLVNKPVYVVLPNSRPFSMAFHSLLLTRLVSKGMQVSETREADSLILEYDVQMILYESSRRDWIPSLAAMGIGVADMFSGKYTSTSDHEIIINSRIVYHNRYVMHLSSIHYINDADFALYVSPQSFDPAADTSRNVRFVNR